MKIRLRETLAGVGNDGEIVVVPDHDVSWYVLRGFADLISDPVDEPIGEPAVEQREVAVSAQAVRRTRRGRSSK